MPAWLKTVNAPRLGHGLWQTQIWIWAIGSGLALLSFITGADDALAKALYQPDLQTGIGSLAWKLRQYGALIPSLVVVGALGAMFWPNLWQTRSLVYRACAVMLLTAVLGAGLLNQVIVQNIADRHRPRESVLLATPAATELSGNSMPSGHAAMGFVLAAPYFVLRRRRPRWAQGFLVLGLGAGALVGFGRMVLGAHFLSDILMAGVLCLSPAALLAVVLEKWPRIPRRILVGGALLAWAAVLVGNRFTLTLTLPLNEPLPRFELPCVVEAQPASEPLLTPRLEVEVTGYGSPATGGGRWTGLYLKHQDDAVSLSQGIGFYHSLTCKATLWLGHQSQLE